MKISVVIPVKNEVHKITRCLDSLLAQTVQPYEILVIDSGSTDGTQEVVRGYSGVTLMEIPPSEFNHGGTRNRGARMAKGDYILFTVQDAWAYDNDWIKKLVTGFADSKVVAVTGSQVVPHEKGANPIEWFRAYSEPVLTFRSFTTEAFNALTPLEKRVVCGFDNVNAIYKKDILLEHPLPEVMEGEDTIWAKEMYLKGFTLAFNPGARVYHYHTEPANYIYKRTLLNAYIGYKHFNFVPDVIKKSNKQKLSQIKSLLNASGLSVQEKWHWYKYNKMIQLAIQNGIIDFRKLLSENEANLEIRCKELMRIGLERV